MYRIDPVCPRSFTRTPLVVMVVFFPLSLPPSVLPPPPFKPIKWWWCGVPGPLFGLLFAFIIGVDAPPVAAAIAPPPARLAALLSIATPPSDALVASRGCDVATGPLPSTGSVSGGGGGGIEGGGARGKMPHKPKSKSLHVPSAVKPTLSGWKE